jgi:signal transduction histidine kinase
MIAMKTQHKHRRILILMITSQVLLTLFVLQWLRSQYHGEKERLAGELTGLYIDTQDEIIDTLLFRSYVNPVLESHRNDSLPNDSLISTGPKNVKGFISWAGNKKAITVRLNHGTDTAVPVPLPDTLKFRKINDEMLLRSVKLIVSHTRDSGDNGLRVRDLEINPDTAVFKEHFYNRITGSGMKLNISWEEKPVSHSESRNILYVNPANPFSLPGVSITRYNGYLAGKILPQILFGLILIFITGFAFVISYRRLRDNVILNNLRNEFVSNMTHELKTPVATISIALESLGRYNMRNEPEVMDEYLRLASSETERLTELINRVLDHSMLEENNQLLKPVLTDVNSLVSDVTRNMQQRLEKCGTIEFNPSPEKINVLCDPLFLRGVIINLIDNSIKYCDKDPVIRILAGSESGSAIIEVADNGPGIPEEYHNRIFEKFFRMPTGNVHNVKGYGLGLSFAYLVMKLHKGSISIKNLDPGCSFKLKLPLA